VFDPTLPNGPTRILRFPPEDGKNFIFSIFFIIYPDAMGNVHNVSQGYKNRRVCLHYALSFWPKNIFLVLARSGCFLQHSSPGVERNLSLFPQGKAAGADNSDNCL